MSAIATTAVAWVSTEPTTAVAFTFCYAVLVAVAVAYCMAGRD